MTYSDAQVPQGAQGSQVPPGPPVTPDAPLVGFATALAVISVLLGAAIPLVMLAKFVLPADQLTTGDTTLTAVLGGILLAGGLLVSVLGIAQLILGIMVVVRGRGLLRRGGIVLLVAWAIGVSISLSASGDASMASDGVAAAMRIVWILGIGAELLRAVLMLVGAVILLRGIAQIRRRRAPTTVV